MQKEKVKLDVGNKLLLHDKKTNKYFDCSIVDKKGHFLVISKPLNMEEGTKEINKGERLEFQIRTDTAIFMFTAVIEKRYRNSLYGMKVPTTVKRKQNREYFRLDVSIDVEFIVLDDDKDDNKDDHNNNPEEDNKIVNGKQRGATAAHKTDIVDEYNHYLEKAKEDNTIINKTQSINISGGGVQFISNIPLKKGITLLVRLCFPDMDDLLLARGVIVYYQEDAKLKFYKISVRFIDLDNAISEKIVKFIYKYQRELRKREI